MKIAKIEWRLRAVTRYLLTRYEEPEQPEGNLRYGTHVQSCGEYDSIQLGTEIGLALTSMDAKKHPDVAVRFDDINVPAPRVRAKMRCNSVWPTRNSEGTLTGGAMVTLNAVYECGAEDGGNAALENRIFSKATPNASVQMQIENPEAVSRFVQGAEYYVDFVPVPQPGELLAAADE